MGSKTSSLKLFSIFHDYKMDNSRKEILSLAEALKNSNSETLETPDFSINITQSRRSNSKLSKAKK